MAAPPVTRTARFEFGENWASFLTLVDDGRVERAKASLVEHLGDLGGKSFLDIGSGSGLFSLAARNLGASVVSFDFDPSSVWCAEELRRRFRSDDPDWRVMQGSALDEEFLAGLGRFDVVYSWGVLHHTGDLWRALANVVGLGNPGGRLFISVYNDQGRPSRLWGRVKRRYNEGGAVTRAALVRGAAAYFRAQALPDAVYRRLGGIPAPLAPPRLRGMDEKHDLVDWVGGYPFEVASPDQIFGFFRDRGLVLDRMKTCGAGIGCNEFVFVFPG